MNELKVFETTIVGVDLDWVEITFVVGLVGTTYITNFGMENVYSFENLRMTKPFKKYLGQTGLCSSVTMLPSWAMA